MRLTVGTTAFQVDVRGEGEIALVFLHYFGGSSRAWAGVIAGLADTYRCIAPDLRGFGASETTDDRYSVGAGADDVAALIAALHLTRYAVVGHSMGGKIALALAARCPPGLESLVLVAPSPPTPEPIPDAERARLLAGYGERAAAEATLGKITAYPLPPALHAQAVADTLRSSHPAWRWWLERGSREDLSALMGQIALPTRVIAGGEDAAMTAPLLEREVVRRIAGATLAILPGAAHLIPLEAPEETARLIRAAVKQPPHA